MRRKVLYFALYAAAFAWFGKDGQAQNPPVNATQLRGRNISTTAPTNGQVYVWNASTGFWTPGASSGGGVTSVSGTANQVCVATGTTTPVLSICTALDLSGLTSTKPIKSGTSLPATCGVGEFYDKTDATAGSNLYSCTATNTWTVVGGGASPAGSAGAVQLYGTSTTFKSALTTGNEALIGNAAIPHVASGGNARSSQLIVNQDYTTDPISSAISYGIVGQASMTTPDDTIFEADGADFFASWKGTTAPFAGSLTFVGTSGYAYIGDPFDSTVSANASFVFSQTGGYFASGIIHSGDEDLSQSTAIFATVDNLNSFNSGGTAHIVDARILQIHNGVHTNITALYGIYFDDLSGATTNEGIHSAMTAGSGKFFINATGNAASSFGGDMTIVGAANISTGTPVGSAAAAVCWKTSTTLSYCTSVVGAGGTCTCH